MLGAVMSLYNHHCLHYYDEYKQPFGTYFKLCVEIYFEFSVSDTHIYIYIKMRVIIYLITHDSTL